MTEFARCPAFNIECQYVTEVDRLSAEKEAARMEERAAIVAWLRVLSNFYADAIEAGEHLK